MMMSTLNKLTESLIWGNSFIVKNIGFLYNMLPLPYCVTRPQWVKQNIYLPISTKLIKVYIDIYISIGTKHNHKHLFIALIINTQVRLPGTIRH